jgi:hypothetical protein
MPQIKDAPVYWRTYRQLPGKAEFFPSDHSLRWFLRVHEQELVRTRAMIRHHRKPMLLPDRFDAYVVKIAARQAKTFAFRQTEE